MKTKTKNIIKLAVAAVFFAVAMYCENFFWQAMLVFGIWVLIDDGKAEMEKSNKNS